jgi:DNA-binding transcriptional LysR family regulator
MDRFHLMNVFIAVAEEQGFASGARRLSMSPPAVTRAIAALEQRLGVKLLNRTTRHVRTTEAGYRYLEDTRRVLAEADAADAAVSGINTEPRGHLAITAPVMFGHMFVMPEIIDYLERFPATEISALFLDRDVNLLQEGIDVAIRIGELPDSSMRALRVGVLVHLVDVGTALLEERDPLESYDAIRAELGAYEATLLDRSEVVALNKVDLLPERDVLDAIEAELEKRGRRVHRISSATGEGVPRLLASVTEALDTAESAA